jgi:hypothetical protein
VSEDEIMVESPEELYRILLLHHAKMRVEKVGTLAFFFAGMREYTDPNTCECLKGNDRKESLWGLYSSLPKTMKPEAKVFVRDLFGGTIILKNEGVLVGRLE